MSQYRCECGDTECPSCGTVQGTYPSGARTFTLEQIQEAENLEAGYCVECGAMRDQCEPDASEYPCEECGERAVYGAQELVIMGRVK